MAVLETDERVVVDMVRLGRPELLVLLNLSRDQLDRHHELMRQVTSPAGRYVTTRIGGVVARLLLAKNPAEWAEAMRLAQSGTS